MCVNPAVLCSIEIAVMPTSAFKPIPQAVCPSKKQSLADYKGLASSYDATCVWCTPAALVIRLASQPVGAAAQQKLLQHHARPHATLGTFAGVLPRLEATKHIPHEFDLSCFRALLVKGT